MQSTFSFRLLSRSRLSSNLPLISGLFYSWLHSRYQTHLYRTKHNRSMSSWTEWSYYLIAVFFIFGRGVSCFPEAVEVENCHHELKSLSMNLRHLGSIIIRGRSHLCCTKTNKPKKKKRKKIRLRTKRALKGCVRTEQVFNIHRKWLWWEGFLEVKSHLGWELSTTALTALVNFQVR